MDEITTRHLTRDLSKEFSRIIRSWLHPAQLSAVVTLNIVDTDKSICHSHDFCDPNQAMIDALAAFGIEYCAQDAEQSAMINAAWAMSKSAHFAN